MLNSKRIKVKDFDGFLLAVAIVISLFGLLTIFSAAHSGPMSNNKLWIAQAIRLGIALVAMFVALIIEYRILYGFSYIIYVIWAVLLAILLTFPEQSGVRRWFMKGAIQPSELAKIILIITLARFLSDKKHVADQFRIFAGAMVIVMVYTILIFMQPALGYALTLIPIALSMFYIGGISSTYLLLLIIPGFVASSATIIICHKGWDITATSSLIKIALVSFGYGVLSLFAYYMISKTRTRNGKKWVKFVSICIFAGFLMALAGTGILKDYQKARLLAFVNPDFDPKGAGYQIIQSKIAIGAGGIFGQGYLKGTQNRLDFLPAQHTDFVFSVVAEEWGFVGAVFLMFLFLTLITRCLKAAYKADDDFGALLATGITAMIITQVFMNIGMTVGMMPITGVPLPLMSYGGSSLVATFISVGLILNVRLKRQ
ncbi:rod shape-determining protein RodA [Candidatus Poribacteria bacterium]|nr:rod shape-determining protein RodA [Candidatus Poribacteria bacterium]